MEAVREGHDPRLTSVPSAVDLERLVVGMGGHLRWFDRDGGVRMPWMELGDPAGPTIVALPGLSDGLMPLSEPPARRLAASAPMRQIPFRVLALSHRHPAAAGVSTRDLADDAAAFVDGVVGEPVVVTGHSMGGMVAQWLAVRRPDLVSRLVLTATLARPDQGFRDTLERWQALVEGGEWRAFAADANAVSYTGSELLRRRLLLRLSRPGRAPHLVDRHRALTRACLDHDARGALGRITCPTLVMAGACDPVVAPSASRALADGIEDVRFVVLEELAHGFPEQSPARTFAEIVAHVGPGGEVAA